MGTYYSVKICNQYLNVNIPKNYVIFALVINLTTIPVTAFFTHLRYDIFGAEFTQIMARVRDSENENVQLGIMQLAEIIGDMGGEGLAKIRQLTEIIGDIDGGGLATILQMLQGGSFVETFSNIKETFSNIGSLLLTPTFKCYMTPKVQLCIIIQFLGVLWQIFRQWMQGNSTEDFITNSLGVLGSNATKIDFIRSAFGRNSDMAGANFILDEVLKDASQLTKDAFETMDVERKTIQFIVTKAVAIYVIGSKKEEDTPSFFSIHTEKRIQALRTQIRKTPALVDDYEKILEFLDDAAAKEVEDESFFAFQDEIKDNLRQKNALIMLQEIAELQQMTY